MFICFYSHNITLMYVHFIIFFYFFLHSILSQPNKSSRGSRFVAQYEAQRTRRKSKIDMEINVASLRKFKANVIHDQCIFKLNQSKLILQQTPFKENSITQSCKISQMMDNVEHDQIRADRTSRFIVNARYDVLLFFYIIVCFCFYIRI